MSIKSKLRAQLLGTALAPVLLGAVSLGTSGAAFATCMGPGAGSATTTCLAAIAIPGNPLLSYDISFVNTKRGEYYLGDRSNASIDVISTSSLTVLRQIGGFVGFTGNNNTSGPDGVAAHGKWLYAGDGNSTLKVIDLSLAVNPVVASISTGGTTRVDEMALTTDGILLLAANNAEDPPFGTLFQANGDRAVNQVSIIRRITVDPAILPPGHGLSIEQPAWDPTTQRFYVSIPVVNSNIPAGCSVDGPTFCNGGMLVVDPLDNKTQYSGFNPATNTGVVFLHGCGPNGATVGPNANLLLGCTPQNNPADKASLVISALSKNYVTVANITGNDEVWFNSGDNRYYLAASRDCGNPGGNCPNGGELGVVDGKTSVLIEKIPQSSGSHSVAADSVHNYIFVPQNAQTGTGHDVTTVGAQICGTGNGCIAVYQSH